MNLYRSEPPGPCKHRTYGPYEECYKCGMPWDQLDEESE